MSKILELPDAVSEQLEGAAAAEGISPVDWILQRPEGQSQTSRDAVPWERFPPEFIETAAAMAARQGVTTDSFVTAWWREHGPGEHPTPSTEEVAAFHSRYCGTLHSGDPLGSNNDRIDTDLAREYLGDCEDGEY